jgi:mannose-6-phosphate isomerase
MKIDARKIYRLKGIVQHYAWGGFEYIPQLLDIDNAGRKPFAEYWMGAHRSAPSQLIDDNTIIELDKLFSAQPELLGKDVHQKFRQLPYLFKVLDVKEMLSIQVHPGKAAAEKGFDAEDERGVAADAPNRNYKDRNHKPEVMIALSDFWLLHGFRSPDSLRQTLNDIPQFRSLVPIFDKEGYRGLYQYVMELPQHEVDAMLLPLVQKEVRRRSFHDTEKDEPGYWVGEYYLNKPTKQIDRGIFAVYFLNLVHLEAGQAIFQSAGVPHAYLQGQNMELMANSDNVLRGGLTNKYIDVPELVKHTRFEALEPAILSGEQKGKEVYFSLPVDDFAISRITLEKDDTYAAKARSAEIIICTEGSGNITSANSVQLEKGDACIVFAGADYILDTKDKGNFFRATVG